MDAFETIVADILAREGWWTTVRLKVDLTKAEKRQIGRHSAPRWELDVVAYRGRSNELLVVECKSLLDSHGVQAATFLGKNKADERRYKLFFDRSLRRVVFGRLVRDLVRDGLCRPKPKVKLALAAGKIKGGEEQLGEFFGRKGWLLIGPTRIRSLLSQMKSSKYENSVATMAAKILLRGLTTETRGG